MDRRDGPDGRDLAARGWQRWWSWWADRRRGGRGPRAVRRVIAALLITAGGVLAVLPVRAAGGTPVAVAATDLPTGGILTAEMVRDQPLGSPPDGAIVTAQAVGRTLAGPVRRGEALTDARLVAVDGPDPGPGRVAVPVRLDDPGVVALLRPGLHVAVLAVNPDGDDRPVTGSPPTAADDADPGSPDRDDDLVTVLAADAVVLSVPVASGSSPLRAGAGAGTVLIAVPHEAADAVAAQAAIGAVTVRFT